MFHLNLIVSWERERERGPFDIGELVVAAICGYGVIVVCGRIVVATVWQLRRNVDCICMRPTSICCLRQCTACVGLSRTGWLIRQSLLAVICGYGSLWVKRVENNLRGFCYILAWPNVLYIKGVKSSTIVIGATKTKKQKLCTKQKILFKLGFKLIVISKLCTKHKFFLQKQI